MEFKIIFRDEESEITRMCQVILEQFYVWVPTLISKMYRVSDGPLQQRGGNTDGNLLVPVFLDKT